MRHEPLGREGRQAYAVRGPRLRWPFHAKGGPPVEPGGTALLGAIGGRAGCVAARRPINGTLSGARATTAERYVQCRASAAPCAGIASPCAATRHGWIDTGRGAIGAVCGYLHERGMGSPRVRQWDGCLALRDQLVHLVSNSHATSKQSVEKRLQLTARATFDTRDDYLG